MAGGHDDGSRELNRTPTWAVALVVAVIILISIILEKILHKVGHTFEKRKKVALVEALEKIKSELMVLGFISLLLTFGQNYIVKICIPEKLADTMLPCPDLTQGHHVVSGHGETPGYESPGHEPPGHGETPGHEPPGHGETPGHEPPGHGETPGHEPPGGAEHRRRLLWNERRILAADSPAQGCKEGYVSLISLHALHQLHIFIFFLAIFHVFYSACTMMLGRLKIRGWKEWERGCIQEFEASNDPSRFRLTHETSFVRGHNSSWMSIPVVFYTVCFFRHIFYAVQRHDYLTLRHGFVSVHLAPGSKFDFQKYIKRSLEDDFKVVVGIPPQLWGVTVIYLLVNVNGWHAMFWLSVFPVVLILAIGTKLQSIISKMALEIQERHAVVQGIPLVQVTDKHFWFEKPHLILHLLHLTLFQNAFEITYFIWISYEFGVHSCFHDNFRLAVLRVSLGILVQILCSYITLPLYALVTQMGSHMKRSIFDEQTSKALKSWHAKIKKKGDNRTAAPKSPQARKLGETVGGSPVAAAEMSSFEMAEKRTDTNDLTTKVDILEENPLL